MIEPVLDEEKRETRRKEGRGGRRRKDGRGGRRDGEEVGTRRKEGWGGRRDEESEKMKKLLKKGRIIGLAGPCF